MTGTPSPVRPQASAEPESRLPTPDQVPAEDRLGGAVRIAFGVIFLWASGVHVGIVSGDPGLYHHFADGAWMPGVLTAWRDIFMAHPAFWGLVVSFFELGIGAALLSGGRLARVGLVGAVAFHVALMTFGWGFWIWSVPSLLLLLGPGRRWNLTDRHVSRSKDQEVSS